MHKHTYENPPLGTIRGKSSSATNGGGVTGWGKTCNNKDSYARLSHEPRGGRAAPWAPVTNQRLSGLDNAPRTSVIPSVHMFDNML